MSWALPVERAIYARQTYSQTDNEKLCSLIFPTNERYDSCGERLHKNLSMREFASQKNRQNTSLLTAIRHKACRMA